MKFFQSSENILESIDSNTPKEKQRFRVWELGCLYFLLFNILIIILFNDVGFSQSKIVVLKILKLIFFEVESKIYENES